VVQALGRHAGFLNSVVAGAAAPEQIVEWALAPGQATGD